MNIPLKSIKKALINTLVIGASVHIGILLFYGLTHQTLQGLNAFDILDLDLYMPSLVRGTTMFLLSWVFIGSIFIVCLYRQNNKK